MLSFVDRVVLWFNYKGARLAKIKTRLLFHLLIPSYSII
jgi:hypothetical protein